MKLNGEIILIDDEQYEQEFLREVLDKLNYEVTIAYFEDAPTALEYLKHSDNEIFMIISDINLGAMSGFKLKEALDADPKTRYKSIPFIFTTNAVTRETICEAYKYNIQGFF